MRTIVISTLLISICWPGAAFALPCRYGNCPGEVGREGEGPTNTTSPAPACPSQSGADCPHSCPKGTPGACPASTPLNYVTLDNVPNTDLRATCHNGKNCKVNLVGDFFLPPSPAPDHKKFPVILYNHGSVNAGCATCKHTPGAPCAIAEYFVSRGYAFFMPHRRGYTPSTGVNQAGPLKDEDADVIDAFKYLKTHKGDVLDMTRVALMGHSLGGMVSLYANQKDFGQVVTISIAGGSESWCGTKLHDTLKPVVKAAKTPVYFLEPKDDVDTGPTIELSHDMGVDGHRFQAAIFGPVANDSDLAPIHCGSEAHVCFVEDSYQVSRWAPSVLEYLHRFDVK